MGQEELLDKILRELTIIKREIPNGEFQHISEQIGKIKEDLNELKVLLMNPEDGIIVKVNKNTEYRKGREDTEKEYVEKFQDITQLKGWQNTVTRVLWIVFGALIGIVVKMIFFTN